MTATPAGWYPDGSGAQRYWDGANWTEHVAPLAPVAPPASGPQKPKGSVGAWVWVVLGVVVLGLVAASVVVAVLALRTADPVAQAKATVTRYDEAWATADCDVFFEATTLAMQEDWGYVECEAFEREARDFDQLGRNYVIHIESATRAGDTVLVHTTETYTGADGGEVTDNVTYTVIDDGDAWRIDIIEFAEGSSNTSA